MIARERPTFSPVTLPNFEAPSEFSVNATAGRLLDEWDSKQRLAGYGLRVPDGRRVNEAEAPAAAAEIGFPVVLKAVSGSCSGTFTLIRPAG